MNVLDVVIVVVAVAAAVGGHRLGFVTRVFSWAGLVVGIVVGAAVLPWVIDRLGDRLPRTDLIFVAAGVVMGAALVGQAVGLLLGARAQFVVPVGRARRVDAVAGALAGVIGVATTVWLVAPAMADVPEWPARAARESSLVRAIDQLFPIMPIHRLSEKPSRRATLADITCDSDGKIEHFIDKREVKDALELHALNDDDYYLGIFLVGAYQEILGDLHNLFGDTHAVQVSLGPNGGYLIDHVVSGDTVTEVLNYVSYNKDDLVARLRKYTEGALRQGRITLDESRNLLRMYEDGLSGYTYLEREVDAKSTAAQQLRLLPVPADGTAPTIRPTTPTGT